MYPIPRESAMVVISSSVAENAVCWCDGRKKRNRRIDCRLTHLAVGGGVIAGAESGMAIGFPVNPCVPGGSSFQISTTEDTEVHRENLNLCTALTGASFDQHNPPVTESIFTEQQLRTPVLRRSSRKPYPVAVRGEGVYVWDADGKRYLDFSGSAAVNFIGHGVPEISAAMAEQAKQLEFVHTSQFTTRVAEEYAQELLDFAGENFRGGAVYFTSGGSEAIETALKLARQYQVEIGQPKRYQVLSRTQSYHGSTLGALAVSGNKRRREIYLPMVREFAHIGIPYCYRCNYDCTDRCRNCGQEYAAELERAIEAATGEVAGFILEPVSGATLGAVVPPPGYLHSIADVCRRHGVLLIADEVMTGMG